MKKLFSIALLVSGFAQAQAFDADSVQHAYHVVGLSAEQIAQQFNVSVQDVKNIIFPPEVVLCDVCQEAQKGLTGISNTTHEAVKNYVQSLYGSARELGKSGLGYVQTGAAIAQQQMYNGVLYVTNRIPESVNTYAQHAYDSAATAAQSGKVYAQTGVEMINQKLAEYPNTTRVLGYALIAGITAKVVHKVFFAKKAKTK